MSMLVGYTVPNGQPYKYIHSSNTKRNHEFEIEWKQSWKLFEGRSGKNYENILHIHEI